MKKIILLMCAPVALLGVVYSNETPLASEVTASEEVKLDKAVTKPLPNDSDKSARQDIIKFASKLLGSPYVYGGTSPEGFDCSGFTTYVFNSFDVNIGRSSRMQAKEGVPVTREAARKGDLVIFTGTNLNVRKPGHVGIIVSSPGDTISFIHSSSNGGVKISQVEGTRYNERFLGVRRVL